MSSDNYIEVDSDISLKDIFFDIKNNIKLVLTITLLFFVTSIAYSISVPDMYKSTALLAPVDQVENVSNSMRGYGGIVGFAGIRMPTQNSNKTIEAVEVLKSYKFFLKNIIPNIKLEDLIAVNSWDKNSNTILYDQDVFLDGKWLNTAQSKALPSYQQSYKVYKNKFNLIKNKETGYIEISIEHHSPFIAHSWMNTIIDEINKEFRESDKIEATLAIEFLLNQISKTDLSEIKDSLSQLVQSETKKLVLIATNEEYVFKTIDPPIISEYAFKPNRLLFILFGFFTGLFMAIMTVSILHIYKRIV